MLEMRTMGECRMVLPKGEIGPSARHPFALLLYLGTERGRWIARASLQQLLFPGVEAGAANHRLRQLVYKLRVEHEAPIESGAEGLRVPVSDVVDAVALLLTAGPEALIARMPIGEFLPAYEPSFSAPLTEWLEHLRGHVHGQLRRRLADALTRLRAAGSWDRAEPIARACLALDPLNEQATLVLAEVLALGGSRAEAVRLLDDYLGEVGGTAPELGRPAVLLRRRIAERLPAHGYGAGEATFRGRGEEMQILRGLLTQAAGGQSAACLVHGEPGIGKSRLVSEFTRVAVMEGARVEVAGCQPHDARRPMGAFSDLVPRLLKLPGALGCSPEAMRFLDRLVRVRVDPGDVLSDSERDPEYLSARITRAIGELLDALTEEATLVIVVEDVQWLDRLSLQVFGDLMSERSERRLVLVLTSREATIAPVTERGRILKLKPLTAAESEAVFREELRRADLDVEPAFLEWCLQIGAGNPYFVRELSQHYLTTRMPYTVPGTLKELLSRRLEILAPRTLRILQAVAVLGKFATFDRVEGMLAMDRVELLAGVQDLEERGLIRGDGYSLATAHAMLSEVAIARAPSIVRRILHRNAAQQFEPAAFNDASFAWQCALHWQSSGDLDRAALVLARAAGHELDLDRPLQALPLTEHALTLPVPPATAQRVIEVALLAAAQGAHWRSVHATIGVLRSRLGTAGYPRCLTLDQRLLELEAVYRVDGDIISSRSFAIEHATNERLDPVYRVRAILILLQIADLEFDSDLAALAYGMLRSPALSGADSSYAFRVAELAYHTVFGDVELAVSSAHRFLELSRHEQRGDIRCRLLQHGGMVLLRFGIEQIGRSALDEMAAAAHDLRLWDLETTAHMSLGWYDWHIGCPGPARDRYRAALNSHAKLGSTEKHVLLLFLAFMLALGEGDCAGADQHLTDFKALGLIRTSRRGRALIVTQQALLHLSRGRSPSLALQSEALELYSLGHQRGLLDSLVEAAVKMFLNQSKVEEAKLLLREYAAGRRDRLRLVPGLVKAYSTLAVNPPHHQDSAIQASRSSTASSISNGHSPERSSG